MGSDNGNSAGLIVGLVLAALIIAGAFIFALPYIRSMGTPQQPGTINVTLPTPPTPTPSPAPEPTPKP